MLKLVTNSGQIHPLPSGPTKPYVRCPDCTTETTTEPGQHIPAPCDFSAFGCPERSGPECFGQNFDPGGYPEGGINALMTICKSRNQQ